jgi:iron complex outermembrane recepter protein
VGTANANQLLAPYHDEQYEAGVKYARSKDFLITLDGFRMTRPYAVATDPTTNLFQVIGTQRNIGAQLFVQGAITVVTTNDKFVVGVPQFKSDIALDYHPAQRFRDHRRRSL